LATLADHFVTMVDLEP